jgi:hypothetical protein
LNVPVSRASKGACPIVSGDRRRRVARERRLAMRAIKT